jgi:Icc-related predicted phosphoesterase
MQETLKLLYASDLHGSNLCFRKIIDKAVEHQVNAIMIGGDIAGKTLTPVVRRPGGLFEAEIVDRKERARGGEELARLELDVANTGSYPVRVTEEEYKSMAKETSSDDAKFYPMMEKRLKHWVWLAECKLKPRGIRLVMICGNDDPWVLDRVLKHSSFAEDPQYQDVVLAGDYEVLGESRGNPTPFACPRDGDEFTLEKSIREKADKIKDPKRAIFILHIPPIDTNLDEAYETDDQSRIRTRGPAALKIHAGSKAVRNVIEEKQPLLALHGHIHESPGWTMIGRTLCLNPGSEYWRGIMHAILITITEDRVNHMNLTA